MNVLCMRDLHSIQTKWSNESKKKCYFRNCNFKCICMIIFIVGTQKSAKGEEKEKSSKLRHIFWFWRYTLFLSIFTISNIFSKKLLEIKTLWKSANISSVTAKNVHIFVCCMFDCMLFNVVQCPNVFFYLPSSFIRPFNEYTFIFIIHIYVYCTHCTHCTQWTGIGMCYVLLWDVVPIP